MSQLFASGSRSIGASASVSVLAINIQGCKKANNCIQKLISFCEIRLFNASLVLSLVWTHSPWKLWHSFSLLADTKGKGDN